MNKSLVIGKRKPPWKESIILPQDISMITWVADRKQQTTSNTTTTPKKVQKILTILIATTTPLTQTATRPATVTGLSICCDSGLTSAETVIFEMWPTGLCLVHIRHGTGLSFQRPRFKLQKLLALIDRAPWRSSATSRPRTPSWLLRRQLDELMPTQPRILPRPLKLLTLTDRPCMRSSAVARLLSHSTMELPRQIRLPRYPHLSSYHQFPYQHWLSHEMVLPQSIKQRILSHIFQRVPRANYSPTLHRKQLSLAHLMCLFLLIQDNNRQDPRSN